MHMGVFAPLSHQQVMKGSCPASTACQNTSDAQAWRMKRLSSPKMWSTTSNHGTNGGKIERSEKTGRERARWKYQTDRRTDGPNQTIFTQNKIINKMHRTVAAVYPASTDTCIWQDMYSHFTRQDRAPLYSHILKWVTGIISLTKSSFHVLMISVTLPRQWSTHVETNMKNPNGCSHGHFSMNDEFSHFLWSFLLKNRFRLEVSKCLLCLKWSLGPAIMWQCLCQSFCSRSYRSLQPSWLSVTPNCSV